MAKVSIELLGEAHAKELLRVASDRELSWTSSVPADCKPSHVAGWIESNAAKSMVSLTFAILEGEAVVGAVTLKNLDADERSGELAFWVGRDHRGRGLASKAGALAIDHAFDKLGLVYLHAHCLRDNNPASRKTLEALGFKQDTHPGPTCRWRIASSRASPATRGSSTAASASRFAARALRGDTAGRVERRA